MSSHDTLTKAYADAEAINATRRRQKLARTFTPNPALEALIALRSADAAAYEQATTATTRISLGSYEAAKRAYEQEKPAP